VTTLTKSSAAPARLSAARKKVAANNPTGIAAFNAGKKKQKAIQQEQELFAALKPAFPDDPDEQQQFLIDNMLRMIKEAGGIISVCDGAPEQHAIDLHEGPAALYARFLLTGNPAPRESADYYGSFLWEQEVAYWAIRGFRNTVVYAVLGLIDRAMMPRRPILGAVDNEVAFRRCYLKYPNKEQAELYRNVDSVVEAHGGFTKLQHPRRKERPHPPAACFFRSSAASEYYRLLLTGNNVANNSDAHYESPEFNKELTQWALKGFGAQVVYEVLELLVSAEKTNRKAPANKENS
jgi:hypothetical protein